MMKIFNFLLIPSIFFVFLIFLKIGFLFFGGGYAVIPVMHRELVTNLHLLTEKEFLDGIAISQLTPGPVAIIATFTGYCISGVKGAISATVAMFLPGTLLMIFLSKSYNKIKDSNTAKKVLNTIIPVIVGLLISASWQIAKSAISNKIGLLMLIASFLLLVRYKINPAVLIIISSIAGILLHL